MYLIIVYLIVVGLLWGGTNPFIRLASQGIEKINTGSIFGNICLELRTIGVRWKYWLPFILNQLGSVLYVWTLQQCTLAIVVPVANSLSFIFTTIVGCLLGEQRLTKRIALGVLAICLGSCLMIYDELQRN